jgi:hypothetical protein
MPTVGRIVHYTDGDLRVRVAIVTAVGKDGRATLAAFVPGSSAVTPLLDIEFSELLPGMQESVGKWSWPPRV